jgi:AcrR family transcriptional regulator
MDGVARNAGVSKQAVCSHFERKEELFRASIKAKIAF